MGCGTRYRKEQQHLQGGDVPFRLALRDNVGGSGTAEARRIPFAKRLMRLTLPARGDPSGLSPGMRLTIDQSQYPSSTNAATAIEKQRQQFQHRHRRHYCRHHHGQKNL
jgi:hypothetical protein